jgi:beta-glucosidase
MASISLLLLLLLLAAHGVAPVVGFTRSDFPPDFIFGAATSAYQVSVYWLRFQFGSAILF